MNLVAAPNESLGFAFLTSREGKVGLKEQAKALEGKKAMSSEHGLSMKDRYVKERSCDYFVPPGL